MEKTKERISLAVCLLGSLMVILRMVSGSSLFMLLFLIVVSLGIICDRAENKILYILFFVPWAFAIKFSFDQLSLLTVLSAIYCFVSAIYIVLHKQKVPIFYLSILIVLFLYSFLSLLISEAASLKGILSFLLNFVVIYFSVLFVRNKTIISTYILFHGLGLALSGGVNLLGRVVNPIDQYINSYTNYYTVLTSSVLYTRFSGLDLDPNYFAIQALVVIACLAVILFSNHLVLSFKQKMTSYLLIVTLLFMGLLTLSKMFLISFVLFIMLLFSLLFKDNVKKGFFYIFCLTSIAGVLLYRYYDYLYQAFLFRFFTEGNSASSITTGRSDIWMDYYMAITDDARLLFLGNGISDQYLNGNISHNMYLIAWYTLGLVGISLFGLLFITLYYQLTHTFAQIVSIKLTSLTIVPLIITLFANFSLDSFIMDFFGAHVFLILLMLSLDAREADSLSVHRQGI